MNRPPYLRLVPTPSAPDERGEVGTAPTNVTAPPATMLYVKRIAPADVDFVDLDSVLVSFPAPARALISTGPRGGLDGIDALSLLDAHVVVCAPALDRSPHGYRMRPDLACANLYVAARETRTDPFFAYTHSGTLDDAIAAYNGFTNDGDGLNDGAVRDSIVEILTSEDAEILAPHKERLKEDPFCVIYATLELEGTAQAPGLILDMSVPFEYEFSFVRTPDPGTTDTPLPHPQE